MNPALVCACLRAALLVVLMLWAGRAPGAQDGWDPARALAGADWSWAAAQVFDLPGARLHMQRFRARLAPPDAARQLNRAGARRFSRLQLSGAGLLLSGGWQGQHWLAQLRPERDGTAGLVSSLSPQRPHAQGFDAGRYVPPGARRVLQVSGRSPDAPGALASYDCPGTLADVAARVYGALRAAHWQAAESPAPGISETGGAGPEQSIQGAPLLREWRSPDGDQLTVHLYARAQAVALTFWYRPGGQP